MHLCDPCDDALKRWVVGQVKRTSTSDGIRNTAVGTTQPATATRDKPSQTASSRVGPVRFRLLGPVTVQAADGNPVPIPATGTKALLALLLLNANRVVPLDRLVDVLWAHEPPATARTTVQGYVSRLRKLFAEVDETVVIETQAQGYRLVVDQNRIDATLAQRLLATSRGEPPSRRAALLREAQQLWHGPALADVQDRVSAPDLAELRLAVLEARVDADLELGAHDELVGELAELVDEHPYREHLVRQLIIALYRSGRRVAALETYQRFAQRLINEIGIEPSPTLRQLHDRVLHDDASLLNVDQPTPRPPIVSVLVPAQLPNAIAGFVGRTADIAWLDDNMPTLAAPGTSIVGLVGPGGVGKTALAIHWAHRVARRFPDGQLYADLRGIDWQSSPAPPAGVLQQFLLALGVPLAEVPASLEDRASLYRSLLADRRMLVVLDDAHDSEQVLPLLPGSGLSQVLVTSRRRLDALVVGSGARILTLHTLPVDEAMDVLASIAGPAKTQIEMEDRARLAELCGGLPLALRLVGARIAANAAPSARQLIQYLADRRYRLDVLSAEGNQLSVRGTLEATYRALPATLMETYKLLGVFPGPRLDAYVMAALCGVSVGEAAQRLRALAEYSLLHVLRDDQYQVHDLVQLHANETANSDLAQGAHGDALGRLERYFLAAADRARRLLGSPSDNLDYASTYGPDLLPAMGDTDGALAWFSEQWTNILSIVGAAKDAGHYAEVWRIVRMAHDFRGVQYQPDDWLELVGKGLDAALLADDPAGVVWMLSCQCSALYRLGRVDEMLPAAEQAVIVSTDLQDGKMMSIALRDLGTALYHAGRKELAADRLIEALELARRAGYRAGEAALLNNLAQVFRDIDRIDDAVVAQELAFDMYRQIGEHGFAVFAAGNVADLYLERGQLDAATQWARLAVEQATASSLVLQEGFARHVLGRILLALGDGTNARVELATAVRRYAAIAPSAAAAVQTELDQLLTHLQHKVEVER